MRFWDASAVVPLVTREGPSSVCRRWLREEKEMLVWALTPTEVRSALCRRIREGALSLRSFRSALERLAILEAGWAEVTDLEAVRSRAHRLLEIHALRAMDALQLAAALIAFEDRPTGEAFLSFDLRLSEAARREGFRVLPHP